MSTNKTSGEFPPMMKIPGNRFHPSSVIINLFVCALIMTLLSACERNEVQVYDLAQDDGPQKLSQATAINEQIKWQTPTGWTELPASQLRVASFSVKNKENQEAQTTIIPLANLAGKNLENVNRWRGQVGLEPINASILATQMQTVKIADLDGQLYDMAGTPPSQNQVIRILGAILTRKDITWFVKMTGPDALVASQKTVFIDFLRNLSFVPIASTNTAAITNADSSTSKPTWKIPQNWKELPSGPMQVAKFQSGDEKGTAAEISVAVFPGNVGGTLANVNRWRGQIGLSPVQENDLSKLSEPLDLGTNKAILVNMMSEQSKIRLMAVIVPKAGQTWFYKIMGQDAMVAREKDIFLKFIQSAQ